MNASPSPAAPLQPVHQSGIAPALTLMLLAPLIAEVLPGATRFSAIFVLPIEICMWGGGALFVRYAVRRWQLGWRNMLLLALALSLFEECLVQQTSLAPLVVQIKGQTYARAFGINYVYLLWALVYESVFVVFIPVHLTGIIFRRRRDGLWLNRKGAIVVAILFGVGAFFAWFSWTQIARPKVFHVPVYHPPTAHVAAAGLLIAGLIYAALGRCRNVLAKPARPLTPPPPWLAGTAACLWANVWYALVLLAFGVAPQFPPLVAVAGAVLVTVVVLILLPRWSAHPRWGESHHYAVLAGAVLGSMMLSFVGFIGALPLDLCFKIGVDALATVVLLGHALRLRKQRPVLATASSSNDRFVDGAST